MSINSIADVVHLSQTVLPGLLAPKLKSFSKKDVGEAILATTAVSGQDPLSALDVQLHTLGVLYLLSARLVLPQLAISWSYVENFCATFEPDVARLAPERVTLLARGIAWHADSNNNLKGAIGPLRDLLHRYPPNTSWLTTIHSIYLKVCVKSHHYALALPLLSRPIMEIDRTLSDITYADNLTYHYLGGVVFAVLKKYEEATDMLDIAVSAPGQVISAVQLEAFKKLSLIQLILYGKVKNPSKYTNPALSRHFKQSPYQLLIKSFPSVPALASILERDQGVFTGDGNVGLIKEVIHHAPRWIVRKLTDTYLTLSMEEISKAISQDVKSSSTPGQIDVATNLVLSMIERNEIYATITPSQLGEPSAATVTFRDAPPPASFNPIALEKIVREARDQGLVLSQLDRQMGISKEYLSKALKDKAEGASPYDDPDSFGGDPMMRRPEWDD